MKLFLATLFLFSADVNAATVDCRIESKASLIELWSDKVAGTIQTLQEVQSANANVLVNFAGNEQSWVKSQGDHAILASELEKNVYNINSANVVLSLSEPIKFKVSTSNQTCSTTDAKGIDCGILAVHLFQTSPDRNYNIQFSIKVSCR